LVDLTDFVFVAAAFGDLAGLGFLTVAGLGFSNLNRPFKDTPKVKRRYIHVCINFSSPIGQ